MFVSNSHFSGGWVLVLFSPSDFSVGGVDLVLFYLGFVALVFYIMWSYRESLQRQGTAE